MVNYPAKMDGFIKVKHYRGVYEAARLSSEVN